MAAHGEEPHGADRRSGSEVGTLAVHRPGTVHVATDPGGCAGAVAHATLLGVPDGEPATVRVEPAGC